MKKTLSTIKSLCRESHRFPATQRLRSPESPSWPRLAVVGRASEPYGRSNGLSRTFYVITRPESPSIKKVFPKDCPGAADHVLETFFQLPHLQQLRHLRPWVFALWHPLGGLASDHPHNVLEPAQELGIVSQLLGVICLQQSRGFEHANSIRQISVFPDFVCSLQVPHEVVNVVGASRTGLQTGSWVALFQPPSHLFKLYGK